MFGRMMRTWPRLVAGMGLLALFLGLCWATGIADQPIPPEDLNSTRGRVIFAVSMLIVIFGLVALPTWGLAAIAPGMLGLVDLFLLTLLCGIPATLALGALGAPGWTYCLMLGAIYLVLHQVFYGRWLEGVFTRDTRTRRDVFDVAEPCQVVWGRLAPLRENQDTFYWPRAQFGDAPEGSGADFALHAPRRRGLKDADELIWIEALEPSRAVTIRSEPLPGAFGVKERRALRLSEVGAHTRVEIETTFLDVSIFHRFRLWLNNDATEFAVSLKNRALGRKDRTTHGRQVLPS
ncbi:MAG: hypothetical protein AAGJ39_11245 [Pseudomonadota bacterium]